MATDLTVLPIQFGNLDSWLAYNRMALECDYSIFNQIVGFREARARRYAVKPQPLPATKRCEHYDEEGLIAITQDAYGTPLTYALAADFRAIKTDGTSEWNKAVIAMLCQLPSDTPVVLWWH